jgi:hypothetical protein
MFSISESNSLAVSGKFRFNTPLAIGINRAALDNGQKSMLPPLWLAWSVIPGTPWPSNLKDLAAFSLLLLPLS